MRVHDPIQEVIRQENRAAFNREQERKERLAFRLVGLLIVCVWAFVAWRWGM